MMAIFIFYNLLKVYLPLLNVWQTVSLNFVSQVKAKEVICQAVELVRELVSGMSNFLTYTEQVFNYCKGKM